MNFDKTAFCDNFNTHLDHLMECDDNYDIVYSDAMEMLRDCAAAKGIEFDGYYASRLRESANGSFNDTYFDHPERRDYFVFLAARKDSQVMENLKYLWTAIGRGSITEQDVDGLISEFKSRGVSFEDDGAW